ncbi:MAG TPA: tetratricopeptide repeat protein [Pyrinomonadaceae bacterium]|jgi:tetratricopeptide (TPR) repeat protein
MQTSCPSCGAETFPGARFCRRCGAPVGDHAAGAGEVSPHAATVPLAPEEGRATDGLAPEEERVAQPTARVSVAELERLLRSQDEPAPPPPRTPLPEADPEATIVPRSAAATRPDFDPADYDEELTITVPRTPLTREAGDFEATADLEATQVIDLEATRPSSYKPSAHAHVTRDAPARVGEDDAAADDDDEGEGAAAGWYEGAAVGHDEGVAGRHEGAAGGASNADVWREELHPPQGGRAAAGGTAAAPRRAWPSVVAVCAVVAVLASGAAWLAFRVLRRPAVTDVPTQAAAPPPVTEDARRQFELKLEEAEAQLAAGDMDGALARLREANALDPANTRARRRLAELLLSTGARREAIEELRAVARHAPEDSAAWRQLAAAQFAEGLHRDAAESYRRLFALVGEQAADPAELLAYADALRLSGRAEEARPLYERLGSSPAADVAAAARQRLAEQAPGASAPTPAPTPHQGAQPSPTPGDEVASQAPTPAPPPAQPTPAPPQPTPTPAPPAPPAPADRYGRGVQLWSSDRAAALAEFRAAAAGGNLDAHYYLGLAYVEGRGAGSLKRAEVVAALQHFQLAQRGGRHASQARGYAQQLEKEFDRLRNK